MSKEDAEDFISGKEFFIFKNLVIDFPLIVRYLEDYTKSLKDVVSIYSSLTNKSSYMRSESESGL
jgi:hypothetical protein